MGRVLFRLVLRPRMGRCREEFEGEEEAVAYMSNTANTIRAIYYLPPTRASRHRHRGQPNRGATP